MKIGGEVRGEVSTERRTVGGGRLRKGRERGRRLARKRRLDGEIGRLEEGAGERRRNKFHFLIFLISF